MDIVNIPVGQPVPPEERQELVRAQVFPVHDEKIYPVQALHMVSPGQSPSVDFEFDIAIDIPVRYKSENRISLDNQLFDFPVLGEDFSYSVQDIVLVETRFHKVEIQVRGKPVEPVEEQQRGSSLEYEALVQYGIPRYVE